METGVTLFLEDKFQRGLGWGRFYPPICCRPGPTPCKHANHIHPQSSFGKNTHFSRISNFVLYQLHNHRHCSKVHASHWYHHAECRYHRTERLYHTWVLMSPNWVPMSSHRTESVCVFYDVPQCFTSVTWCFTSDLQGFKCFMMFYEFH